MQRKWMFLFTVLVLSSLILSSIGTAVAQSPLPPAELEAGKSSVNSSAPSLGSQSLTLPSISIGQSGLSFRYLQTLGVTETPYISDTTHLNRPEGLFMDASNNLYVTESQGSRMLRYNTSGVNTLAIGKAGVSYTDDYVLRSPADAALDSGGNIWVVDNTRVVQYTPGGVILRSLPAQNDNPWNAGNTNGRFDNARGIAFDSDGRMYVSDSNNNRVQLYDMSTGNPVYRTTIGTGTAGSGSGQFNSPSRIAVYSNNHLYVVDNGNNRIQHCIYSGATWSCNTLDSGLNNPQGIAVDSHNNVYISDTNNGRIRKCTSSGVCSDFVTNTYWSYDLAVDSNGNIYSSTSWSAIVVKYDSHANLVGTYVGVENVPYLTDNYHYNHPRVAIDSSNNIIIVEENGQRLIKLNASGIAQWSIGVPGVDKNDNTHFNGPHGVAVDQNGNIYVADGFRVQIFSGNGSYLATLGSGDNGTHNNYQFSWITGIAVDGLGNIYVSDCYNDRVQIYNGSRTYIATLGVTATPGSDNGHLKRPIGVGVDSALNIYVVDAGNNRVQKFSSNRIWQMTLGTPGPWGSGSDDFAHFGSGPEDVAVDAQGRIYIADIWNNRVEVFDSSGAYLTTIGGAWGANTSQFRNTSGVDIDNQGNVYVADLGNARIQKFAPGVPGWLQANINGFGDRYNDGVSALEVFNNQLYAGSGNWDEGGSIWRSTDAHTWTQVSQPGFGDAYTNTNTTILDMVVFNEQLYASSGWGNGGGQLWRSSTGTTWEQVMDNGFGSANIVPTVMAIFNNMLYVGTGSTNIGFQIWRSDTGNQLSWTNVVTHGLGNSHNRYVTGLTVFNDALYAAVEGSPDPPTGMQIWHTANGSDWSQVGPTGFGSAENWLTGGFAIFNGNLYIGTRNDVTGGQVWHSNNGSTWTQVVGDGFGDHNNTKVESLYAFDGNLYAGMDNSVTGVEIWRSSDGASWNQINPDGFGDSNNDGSIWSSAYAVLNGSLFVGTWNNSNGGEIWEMIPFFTDVSISDWAFSWINRLYAAGITSGCSLSPLLYCPDDAVTRAQMAKFLEKGIHGSAYTPPAGTGMIFADVPLSNWAVDWIENLYTDGITSGCQTSPLSYCPDQTITRDQMAKFLLVAKHGAGYTPPAVGASTGFNDVSTSFWAAAWIKQLALEGITSGCGGGNYCPGDPVTRAQMAKFLVLTFNLP